ncbi:hypothetical protein [Sporomusa aerivorans]|uniref:hypothetical protein n=1 Tax=Sporomusa aerivorans TaxID=204936 RepID=UPI00352A7F5C
MCPYYDNGCKIKHLYAGTNLCSDNYLGCAYYMAATVRGVEAVPDTMTALDYALLQKTEAE